MIPRLFDPATPAPCGEVVVADVVRAYVGFKSTQCRAGIIKAEAEYKARLYCHAFAELLGEQPVSSCRRSDLSRFLQRHPEYKSPHTKHDATGAVVAAFRWAAEDGLIPSCPYARPRDLPTPEPRAHIKRSEVRAILEHARHGGYRKTCERFRLAAWFLFETGCRPCEMYALRWEHLDRERGLFELRIHKTKKKTARSRLIVLTRAAWKMVRLLERKVWGEVVFPNGQGRPWNKSTFGKLFRRHADLAGVRSEVSAYSLRHGFCVERLEAGVGERQVADAMGHAGTKMVGWYGRGTRGNIDYLREAMERRR